MTRLKLIEAIRRAAAGDALEQVDLDRVVRAVATHGPAAMLFEALSDQVTAEVKPSDAESHRVAGMLRRLKALRESFFAVLIPELDLRPKAPDIQSGDVTWHEGRASYELVRSSGEWRLKLTGLPDGLTPLGLAQAVFNLGQDRVPRKRRFDLTRSRARADTTRPAAEPSQIPAKGRFDDGKSQLTGMAADDKKIEHEQDSATIALDYVDGSFLVQVHPRDVTVDFLNVRVFLDGKLSESSIVMLERSDASNVDQWWQSRIEPRIPDAARSLFLIAAPLSPEDLSRLSADQRGALLLDTVAWTPLPLDHAGDATYRVAGEGTCQYLCLAKGASLDENEQVEAQLQRDDLRIQHIIQRYFPKQSDSQDREDCSQDVHMKLSVAEYHRHPNPTGFAVIVTIHACNDRYRKRKRRRAEQILSFGPDGLDPAGREMDPADQAEIRELIKNVQAILPPEEFAVLISYYVEGQSVSEIAESMQKTKQSVYRLKSRGLKRIRDRFGITPQAAAKVAPQDWLVSLLNKLFPADRLTPQKTQIQVRKGDVWVDDITSDRARLNVQSSAQPNGQLQRRWKESPGRKQQPQYRIYSASLHKPVALAEDLAVTSPSDDDLIADLQLLLPPDQGGRSEP
jgi:RNA polymerase sigma factor (sigma-70 family)